MRSGAAQAFADGARAVQAEQAARDTSLRDRENAVAAREQEVAAQIEGIRAAVEAIREGTVTRGLDGRPQITDATHAALLRPVWWSLGPIVMALVDLRAELTTGLQRFRDLFRRNKLQPHIAHDGKDLLDGIDP